MPANGSFEKMSRPATAFQKVLDKVGSVFSSTETSRLQHDSQLDDKATNIFSVSSQKLYLKLSKMLKIETRSKNLKMELCNDFGVWGQSIPNLESSAFVKEFSALLNTQINNQTILQEKMERLKLSLSFVNEREKKQKGLITAKLKLEKQLKEAKAKFGPNASNTILLNEKAEEVDCNLQVVEQQYIRSITNDLKDALIDYAYSMSAAARKAEDSSSSFIQYMTAVENDMVAGSIENDFVRFSPNKYSKLLKRKESKYQLPNLLDGGIVGSGVQQLKVKNYNLPTPQSPCPECKKMSPCIHTDGAKVIQPSQRDNNHQQQHQQVHQQTQLRTFSQPNRNFTVNLQHPSDDSLGNEVPLYTTNRENSMSFSDHWS